MQLSLVFPIIAVTAVLCIAVGSAAHQGDTPIEREPITDFSYFPMPTLPSARVLDNAVLIGAGQNLGFEAVLAGGHDLIAIRQDVFYNDTTLFYATPSVQKTVTNDDSIPDLVRKGVIVFDYEKISNLEARHSGTEPIFMTRNSNPVYESSGLNGKYFTISYYDDDTRLSIYGNESVDLEGLIRSMNL